MHGKEMAVRVTKGGWGGVSVSNRSQLSSGENSHFYFVIHRLAPPGTARRAAPVARKRVGDPGGGGGQIIFTVSKKEIPLDLCPFPSPTLTFSLRSPQNFAWLAEDFRWPGVTGGLLK
nr:hypothetical protein CFP56_38931 [Quercus suber]